MKMKILRHKKDEVELAGSKRNDDVVVREVEEEVEDSEGHSSDEGNMSDVWNSGDSEREESGNEEQEVQRQKEKDLLFEREMRGKKKEKRKQPQERGGRSSRDLSRDVQFIKNELAEGNMNPAGSQGPGSATTHMFPIQLPIANEDVFNEAESLLKNESVRQKMIARLALVGGTNSENLIRRMLATALTNALACRYN
ncbi:hypothetical protein KUCAC02_015323 [Chaenocephalus aceratus]|uniref:Uncharacterized protein n=1 Tax=Chaenocephalus aceratus TaxID=36190 RepID=A0ACB9XX52_CHAAC|nr:hypothetical protein KUCAC02_015323 [Chaenocephalus aceratus]